MDTEIVVNLWAIYDAASGFVYGLSARAYNVTGDENDKLSILKKLSATDYTMATRYNVPERFSVHFMGGIEKKGIVTLDIVKNDHLQLFDEVLNTIEEELPPLIDYINSEFVPVEQKLQDAPLCLVTILYEDEVGNIRPIITKEDRDWAREKEKSFGRPFLEESECI